jgi:hypothetical protein
MEWLYRELTKAKDGERDDDDLELKCRKADTVDDAEDNNNTNGLDPNLMIL